MNDIKWYTIFKVWMFSLFGLDIFWLAYLFIANRMYDGAMFFDWMAVIVYLIIGLSIVLVIINMITSIQDKRYKALGYGFGIVVGGFILFMAMIISVLATVF
ncbi:MAG: hypothetical protein UMR38_07150 [Candidatus Izemoplasma sp.]|nr:hypothetical protein [Candidatus Izemoplasma sp.]